MADKIKLSASAQKELEDSFDWYEQFKQPSKQISNVWVMIIVYIFCTYNVTLETAYMII